MRRGRRLLRRWNTLTWGRYRAWCFDTKAAGFDTDSLTDYLVKDGDAFYGWIGA